MKLINLLFLSLVFNVQSQIWKPQFDTLSYPQPLAVDEGGNQIKHYTITQLNEKDSIEMYNYFEYNQEGLMSKQLYSKFPGQHTDTIRSSYSERVVIENGIEKEYIYDKKNRLVEVRSSDEESAWSTVNVYKGDRLVETQSSEDYKVKFFYEEDRLQRKEYFKNGKLNEYIHYKYPKENTIQYQDCYIIDDEKPSIPCSVTEGQFDEKGRLIKILTKYENSDSSFVNVIEYHYGENGQLIKETDFLHSKDNEDFNGEILFTYNKNGLLIRMQYFKEGERYRRWEFEYSFY